LKEIVATAMPYIYDASWFLIFFLIFYYYYYYYYYYTKDFMLDSLRYIFVSCIVNEPTWNFLMLQLYNQLTRNLTWPDQTPHYWKRGTPEFDSLLGTPIGKTVTCMALGGWGRGTRRIPQIVRQSSSTGYNAYMRFDVEAILWA
jgi:hypothetical protein